MKLTMLIFAKMLITKKCFSVSVVTLTTALTTSPRHKPALAKLRLSAIHLKTLMIAQPVFVFFANNKESVLENSSEILTNYALASLPKASLESVLTWQKFKFQARNLNCYQVSSRLQKMVNTSAGEILLIELTKSLQKRALKRIKPLT